MAQVRGTFAELYDNVDKVVTALLGKQLKELPPKWTAVYDRKSSDRKFERFQTVQPFGDVPEKGEGATYTFDLIRPGYSKDVTPVEFGMGFEASETALEDDQFDVLSKYATWLAFSARVVQEKYAARPFNNGFGTQTTPDGVSLFNTAHVLKGGGTAKNRPSTDADLSFASLQQAMIDVQTETKLESGQLVAPVTSWILYVPPALEMLADRIVNTTALPGSADNDVNPIKRRRNIEIVVNPYLSDADAWFLVAAAKSQHGLVCIDRLPITQAPPMQDSRTGNRIYKIRFRQAWDAFLWQNVYGTSGA
jgi:hypothetical protein